MDHKYKGPKLRYTARCETKAEEPCQAQKKHRVNTHTQERQREAQKTQERRHQAQKTLGLGSGAEHMGMVPSGAENSGHAVRHRKHRDTLSGAENTGVVQEDPFGCRKNRKAHLGAEKRRKMPPGAEHTEVSSEITKASSDEEITKALSDAENRWTTGEQEAQEKQTTGEQKA